MLKSSLLSKKIQSLQVNYSRNCEKHTWSSAISVFVVTNWSKAVSILNFYDPLCLIPRSSDWEKIWSHSKLEMWFIYCITIRETYFRIFQDWMPPRDNFNPFNVQLPNVSPPYFIKSSLFHLKMCCFEKYIITKS